MTVRDLLSSQSSQTAMDFGLGARRAWRVVWRGRNLLLAIMALALVPAILFLRQAPRLYTAEAKILIQSPETNDILSERSAPGALFRMSEEVIQTEVQLISSTLLARRVIERMGLENDAEFNSSLRTPSPMAKFLSALNPMSWVPESWGTRKEQDDLSPAAKRDVDKARVARAFLQGLKVKNERRTHIILVQFTSEDREKAAQITNAMAEIYVLDRLEASFSEARQVSSWLGDRLKVLQQDAVSAETAVERFRSQNDLRRTDRQGTINDQQLSELNSRLVLARTDLAQKQARLQQVKALGKARGSYDTSSDVLQSSLIQRLREQEAIKSREMSEALKTYGDRHPRIIGLRADLDDLQGKIVLEIDKVATSMANDVAVSAAGVASLERDLGDLRRTTNVAGETTVRLRDLERQAEASRSLYETFLGRFKREGEQTNMRRANARIVASADIPVRPSSPPTTKIIAAVMLISLTVGILLVFILDSFDNTVRSSDDAEDLSGLPVFAVIPHHRDGAAQPIAEMLDRPHSALVDGVRGLRTALITGEGGDTGRIILVTSSVPKEGKTFVSLCLATIFSRTEERVLLIDSDVYRPRLHSVIDVDGERGLVEVLTNECAFDDVVQKGIAGSLDFLPAGRAAHLAEILQGGQFDALMDQLKSRYSRIIIDSPPVLAVADVRLIARHADKVIYLVKWGGTPRDGVRNGIKLLRSAGVPLSGVVLSQVDQRKHAQYGYGDYGQYYGRYSDYYKK